MPAQYPEFHEIVTQLNHKGSVKRRSAAKKLRKLKNYQACTALTEALIREAKNTRTWETQYHIIMALGESRCTEALPLLNILLTSPLEFMVTLALGDAITRLEFACNNDYKSLINFLRGDNKAALEGALRGVAMLRLKPDDALIEEIVNFVSKTDNENLRFWVAAASSEWNTPVVSTFLENCLGSSCEETRKAADAAIRKQYLNWQPL